MVNEFDYHNTESVGRLSYDLGLIYTELSGFDKKWNSGVSASEHFTSADFAYVKTLFIRVENIPMSEIFAMDWPQTSELFETVGTYEQRLSDQLGFHILPHLSWLEWVFIIGFYVLYYAFHTHVKFFDPFANEGTLIGGYHGFHDAKLTWEVPF